MFILELTGSFTGSDQLGQISCIHLDYHTGQCKRTGGCYNELVVAFYSTGGGVKGKKIFTC